MESYFPVKLLQTFEGKYSKEKTGRICMLISIKKYCNKRKTVNYSKFMDYTHSLKYSLVSLLVNCLLFSVALSGAEKVFFGGVAFVGSLADKDTLYTHTYPLVKESEEATSLESIYTAKIQELSDSFLGMNLICHAYLETRCCFPKFMLLINSANAMDSNHATHRLPRPGIIPLE